ncbi:MAG: peptide chain release factor N(5)-glutamine methyltransferase [Acidaminococcaceae bacterium]
MEHAQTKDIWTIVKILDWTRQYFADKGIENPRLDAEVLLCTVLSCPRINLYVHFDQPLKADELAKYREYVLRRGRQEPLAYILGEKTFMNYTFKVTPAVLVPRPETELLVEILAELNDSNKKIKVLDLGTGSGAIILSFLSLLPLAEGTAVDVSSAALAVAAENAERLGVHERFTPVLSDLYSELPAGRQYDVIVSNPPYIPTGDIAGLAADVQEEPKGALDGGVDGLDFYRRTIAGSSEYLLPEGLLAFEIGIHQAEAVTELCREHGFVVTAVRKDYAGIERMIFAAKEGSVYADALMAIDKE